MKIFTKKTGILALFSVILAGNLFAISDSEAQNLLQKAEDNTSFYETDFKGNYTVVQNKKKTKRQEIDIQAKELEEQLKAYKNSLISSLTVSAESYIKNFVAFSDDILTSFWHGSKKKFKK